MKRKKIRLRVLVILIVVVVIVIAYLVLGNILNLNKKEEQPKVKIVNKIKDYKYVLEDNKTKLYNSLFSDLKKELSASEVNEDKYAKLVVQLFVADFYDLNNKSNKNDIGGIQFITTSIRDNFILNAKNTMYKYVESNIYGDRKQELPSVKEINIISAEHTDYKYDDDKKEDELAYEVKVEWTYNKDLGYQDSATLILIHEDKILSIAELK
jgi:hypothetical protein